MIISVSSSTGTKYSGSTIPRTGCRQRRKRLHAPHSDAVELEYRLVDEEELVLLERFAQVGLELEPLHGGGLHRRA